jgi:glyoxylase-like metal-dependent hydrolase (beta-lactamase superfamily II)
VSLSPETATGGGSPHVETLDLEFQGTPHVIAAFLVHGPAGPVLVETGPSSTLPVLLAGLERRGVRPPDVRDVLVTHIHLDHAGAAGWWARQGARVVVHSVGAPHLVDPSKLIASATRIYGERMEALWGAIPSAPADRVHAVGDGAIVDAGGLRFRVVETTGHARHHHAFVLGDAAFAGDSTGILLPGQRWIDLPAPPPEFDLPAWRKTLARLRGLGLRTLYRTHFGPTSSVENDLNAFERVLERGAQWIREMLESGLERDAMVAEFCAKMRSWATESGASTADIAAYELANPRAMAVDGIARYWKGSGLHFIH